MGAQALVLTEATRGVPERLLPVAEPESMRTRESRGFTLVEVSIVVAIIGVLATVAIAVFMRHMKSAKQSEAVLQLDRMAKNAKNYYVTHLAFPQGTAEVLPGADGSACANAGKKFAVTNAWISDSVWTDLDFDITEPGLYSYHYASTSNTAAEALAVADLDCDGTLSTYRLKLSAPTDAPVSELIAPVDPD